MTTFPLDTSRVSSHTIESTQPTDLETHIDSQSGEMTSFSRDTPNVLSQAVDSGTGNDLITTALTQPIGTLNTSTVMQLVPGKRAIENVGFSGLANVPSLQPAIITADFQFLQTLSQNILTANNINNSVARIQEIDEVIIFYF